ncbi:unnamed protein product [Adineta steineri]|uniref:Uncharacterized protein n=1 Tax=Adineta steineri TaxID=433720 RepID=A0A813PL13_9BILA|nr:unnamed protein product [Adineta steineri]
MSVRSRPTISWSPSLSARSRSTNLSTDTKPLVTTRTKLLRQTINNQNNFSQYMTKKKHDIEELFQLYYSNNVKFDSFKKQIVTGTRIPTARTVPIPQNNLISTSIHTFDSKHCVSREQLSTLDLNSNEIKTKLTEPCQTHKDVPMATLNPSLSSPVTIPTIPNLPEMSSSTEQAELYDPPLVRSVTFLDDNFNELNDNTNTQNQRPKSSSTTTSSIPIILAPPPSFLAPKTNKQQNEPSVSSQQQQQQQNQPTVVTGSAAIVRHRSPIRQSWNRQRPRSNTTLSNNSSARQLSPKVRPSSRYSSLSIGSDIPEPPPVYPNPQRIVSIPSKCSRYVLVIFPEVPFRYSTPSYVERILLPERFPTLFQNITHSYDEQITNIHHRRKGK